ncbi:MAG: glutamate--tRNA ligase [Armatimonadetes bacterium]|nr:glutamate--tRNA ligase [Armatimonadota bacterium]
MLEPAKPRVRFAPSPTGSLHVGGARTALFNWLFARKYGGRFVLRIEDTDLDRSSPEKERVITDDLRWLGLDWNEGPDAGGPHGPYRQTDRLDLYRRLADRLKDSGLAYWCYCTPEELESRRNEFLARGENPRYDGRCRGLTQDQAHHFQREGRRPALRFRMQGGTIQVHDLVRGDVDFDGDLIGDFVLLKSDGTPSYNFAVVVDDHMMEISHVIRGEEHLTNTPRQIALYQALGLALPEFGHISMILAPDRSKLSKRHGTTAVGEYRERGFLPEALVNYIALLGWAPSDDRELFTLEELIQAFSLDRVVRNPAIFDEKKLLWMNGHYIRTLDEGRVLERFREMASFIQESHKQAEATKKRMAPFFDDLHKQAEAVKKWLPALREKIHTLSDLATLSERYLPGHLTFSPEALQTLVENRDVTAKILHSLSDSIAGSPETSGEGFKQIMKEIGKTLQIGGKALYGPVRSALTGEIHGPELVQVVPLLGKDEALSRIRTALQKMTKQEELSNGS